MRNPLLTVLLMSASTAFAAGPRVDMVLGEFPPKLVKRAADELAADLKRLYHAEVRFQTTVPDGETHVILLGVLDSVSLWKQLSDPLPKLSEQGHAVLSRKFNDRPVLAVVGGSPTASYWAAAELAHQLGIRTMLYGDVDPVAASAFSVEGIEIVREPLVKSRFWQMDFDSPLGSAAWSLSEQRMLLRQLARLKFNRLILSSHAESPAAAVAALRPIAVGGDTAGRSVFGGSKFFQNPDLAAVESNAARRQAADKLLDEFEREAKALGMAVKTVRMREGAPRSADCALPLLVVSLADEQLGGTAITKRDALGIWTVTIGDSDLAAYRLSRGCFDANFGPQRAIDDLLAPMCGEGVSDRVQKAFDLVEEATKLILAGDADFGRPALDVVMKHYASADPPPEWWGKARDNYLTAMNEMYRANTRAREGGRSYTLYFARRFEFAFEYMNSLEALRKAAIAKSTGDGETQLAELEKAVESMNAALNALAAVARSQSDRGIIAAFNEHGYRPLVKELEAAQDAGVN